MRSLVNRVLRALVEVRCRASNTTEPDRLETNCCIGMEDSRVGVNTRLPGAGQCPGHPERRVLSFERGFRVIGLMTFGLRFRAREGRKIRENLGV